jgi:hypothetical protein
MARVRIASCRDSNRSNCIGTALYISGEEDSDDFFGIHWVHEARLKNLLRPEAPVLGCLVGWQGKVFPNSPTSIHNPILVNHLGLVTSLEPLLVTHRNGHRGTFIEGQPFCEIDCIYGNSRASATFYIPRALALEYVFCQKPAEKD